MRFPLEDFASPSSTFSIDKIFIAETTNPFVLRSNPVPTSHQNSFEASLLSGNRIKMEFNPLAQGLIQSTLVIEYTSNGATRKAQLPLSGRGSSSFSLNRRLSISGAGQMFGVLNYRQSSVNMKIALAKNKPHTNRIACGSCFLTGLDR